MDPTRDLAAEAEFNGSESGWTTYIGSPICNDDERTVDMEDDGNNNKNAHGNVDNDGEKCENNDDSNKDTDDEETDDSMASDASSGPSHLQLQCINSEGSNGLDYLKDTENDHEKIVSAKRASKQARKTKYESVVEKEEEDSLVVADSAGSHV